MLPVSPPSSFAGQYSSQQTAQTLSSAAESPGCDSKKLLDDAHWAYETGDYVEARSLFHQLDEHHYTGEDQIRLHLLAVWLLGDEGQYQAIVDRIKAYLNRVDSRLERIEPVHIFANPWYRALVYEASQVQHKLGATVQAQTLLDRLNESPGLSEMEEKLYKSALLRLPPKPSAKRGSTACRFDYECKRAGNRGVQVPGQI